MHTIIIAEAGVNHNGSIDLAKQLIESAAASGADYVKFQTFRTEQLVTKQAKLAEYQKQNPNEKRTQFDLLKKLELSQEDHYLLKKHCLLKNIGFLSTPFDMESANFLDKLGMDFWKIPSGEITNLPYLRYMSERKEPLILSTGMATMEEIENALNVLISHGKSKDEITVLHCTSSYPTPYNEVNLHAMKAIANSFDVKVGYSDHTNGIEVAIAAVALGAKIIEKHFTLDRAMKGPDHKASLEPDELRSMVRSIRNIEQALGNEKKKPSESEQKNKSIVRKSIHISRDLAKDHILTEEDLIMQRPGDGISPMEIEHIIGKKLTSGFSKGTKLKWEDIK